MKIERNFKIATQILTLHDLRKTGTMGVVLKLLTLADNSPLVSSYPLTVCNILR